jgi:hypothetical protein
MTMSSLLFRFPSGREEKEDQKGKMCASVRICPVCVLYVYVVYCALCVYVVVCVCMCVYVCVCVRVCRYVYEKRE